MILKTIRTWNWHLNMQISKYEQKILEKILKEENEYNQVYMKQSQKAFIL